MMNLIEEAIIYATVLHQGRMRKTRNIPVILHPLEVAQILSTMTDDVEIIVSGILHDVVEDTDGTLEEIRRRFGDRVAGLVDAETEPPFPDEDRETSWQKRKEVSLRRLKESRDTGVKMLWLADKLANIRSLARDYSEAGEDVWSHFHQKDPAKHLWYYRAVAEYVEMALNRTGAYKEFIKHINYIWPGTFDKEKTRYKKFKEVSLEGCTLLGRGKKSDVYRYDDELIIKVYNQNNTYRDVEREISLSRRAFVLGIPTVISFGIVSVGDRYGSMYELMDAQTITECIRRNPSRVDFYAGVMAKLAKEIHGIEAGEEGFPDARDRVKDYIANGVMRSDAAFGQRCMKLIEALPATDHLIHGDFHTSNAFWQNTEPLMIDMGRISRGDPIIELGDVYLYYAASSQSEPEENDQYLGIPHALCLRFFDAFLQSYLNTDDEETICNVTDKARFLADLRLINRLWKPGALTDEAKLQVKRLMDEASSLADGITELQL